MYIIIFHSSTCSLLWKIWALKMNLKFFKLWNCNYAFPTGSVYGFGIKRRRHRRRRRTPTISESASNLKNSAYSHQSRPISNIVWTE